MHVSPAHPTSTFARLCFKRVLSACDSSALVVGVFLRARISSALLANNFARSNVERVFGWGCFVTVLRARTSSALLVDAAWRARILSALLVGVVLRARISSALLVGVVLRARISSALLAITCTRARITSALLAGVVFFCALVSRARFWLLPACALKF